MRRALKFIVALILGLALVTWAASIAVRETTRAWFEKDVNLRAQLVVNGARQGLIANWSKEQRAGLRDLLSEITHDERIMAAAACSADFTLLTRTRDFPEQFNCRELGGHVRAPNERTPAGWVSWQSVESLPGGDVHVSAIPVLDRERPLGFVVLVHDLSFVERREATTRRFLLLAFGFLAAAAAAVTMVAARLSWRGWSRELRSFIRGGTHRPEFQPILRDVRELVDRIVAEKEVDQERRRLDAAAAQADAEPLPSRRTGRHRRQPGALHPRARRRRAACASCIRRAASSPRSSRSCAPAPASGSPTGAAPRTGRRPTATAACASRPGRSRTSCAASGSPRGGEGLLLRLLQRGPVAAVPHRAHAPDLPQRGLEAIPGASTSKFADAVCEEVDSDDPIVLVQDYHFALVPRLIRERLPRATVITFWHIPWPNSERFGICPWRERAAGRDARRSILGFHTQLHCNNFLDAVDRYLEARIDREQQRRRPARPQHPGPARTRSRSSGPCAG